MPEGTFYVMVRSPMPDDVAFMNRLADERVFVLPGRMFEIPGWFRISLTASDAMIGTRLLIASVTLTSNPSLRDSAWCTGTRRGARVEHGEDVRVLESGGEADLALEPVGPERGGQLGVEHLERDRAVVLEVLGQEHGGHPPAPELALERVARAQAVLKLRA